LKKTAYAQPSPGKTAFNHVFHTPLNFYAYCANEDSERGSRFSRAMFEVAHAHLKFFEAAYPIQLLPKSSPIVDVAGGFGQTVMYLAERLPCENFVVNDFPSIIEQARVQCPSALSSRIRFEAHDMF
jgi:hypothetical protein